MQPTFANLDQENLAAFGKELAAIGERTRNELGSDEDAGYLRKLIWGNFSCEVLGRALIVFSFEPIAFILGVILLSIHFNLEVTFGHNCGHGAFNSLRDRKGLGKYNSKRYSARNLPASFKGWMYSHNGLHHTNPNIIGKDPDVGYEVFRVTELQGKPKWYNKLQVVLLAIISLPMFLLLGTRTYLIENRRDTKFVLLASDYRQTLDAIFRQLTGNRYFFYNFLLYPVIAGIAFFSFAHFLKVICGNLLAEAIRGLTYGTMFHMGHHTGTVKFYPEGFQPKNKPEWYLLQAETSHNVVFKTPLKHLFGGLDLQIEHHLFPDLPPNRLHQIRPEIERVCRKYGVHYSKASFWKSLLLFVNNYSIHAKH